MEIKENKQSIEDKAAELKTPIEISESYFNFMNEKNVQNDHQTEDSLQLKLIDEIIDMFKNHFAERSNEDIVNSLLATSFNIENAYLYLTDYNYYKGINCFIILCD
jgi:tRNA uridine 5-carbamoylmethylation protein Kti12